MARIKTVCGIPCTDSYQFLQTIIFSLLLTACVIIQVALLTIWVDDPSSFTSASVMLMPTWFFFAGAVIYQTILLIQAIVFNGPRPEARTKESNIVFVIRYCLRLLFLCSVSLLPALLFVARYQYNVQNIAPTAIMLPVYFALGVLLMGTFIHPSARNYFYYIMGGHIANEEVFTTLPGHSTTQMPIVVM